MCVAPPASVGRGNALLISVEKESITIRLVFGGGLVVVGCVRRARRCARLGVEKWVRRDSSVARVGRVAKFENAGLRGVGW